MSDTNDLHFHKTRRPSVGPRPLAQLPCIRPLASSSSVLRCGGPISLDSQGFSHSCPHGGLFQRVEELSHPLTSQPPSHALLGN